MNGPVRSSFLYLMNLAYKSRLHIPFLLTVCFLVLDIRLQLEVNINMHRRRTHERLGIEPDNIEENNLHLGHVHSSETEPEDDEEDEDEDEDDDINVDYDDEKDDEYNEIVLDSLDSSQI